MKQIIANIIIISSILILGLVGFLSWRNHQLKKTGIQTTATVVDERVIIKERKNTKGFQTSKEKTVYPIYEFRTKDNVLHRVDGKMGGYRVTIGEVKTIYYQRHQPEIFYVEGEQVGAIIIGIAGIILGIVGIILKLNNRKRIQSIV